MGEETAKLKKNIEAIKRVMQGGKKDEPIKKPTPKKA